jgi:O-antigen/teichoic acid export membrane protein
MRSKFAKHAASAAWWSAIEIVSRYGVQFVVTLILARLLLPSDFGLIALLLIFTSVGNILIDSGFGAALIQRQRVTPDDEMTVFIFSCAVATSLWVVLSVVAPYIAIFFHDPRLSSLLRMGALAFPLGALGAVPDALLTIRMDFRARTLAQLMGSSVSGLISIGLAALGFGVWSLVGQLLTATAMRTIGLWHYSKWIPSGQLNKESFTNLGRFGGFMLLSSLLNAAYLQVQPLLIGRLFDTRSLGYYSLAQSSQQAPVSLIEGVLSRVGLPVFSAIAHHPPRLLEALRSILRLSLFLFVPCMVGIAVMAKPLVLVIYGQRWLPTAPILSVLAVGATLWPVHVLNLEAIKAQGRSDLFFRLAVFKTVLSIALIFVGSAWGVLGIAWAILIASIIGAIINTYYSWKLLNYGPLAQAREQLPTFALASLAALVGWQTMHRMPAGPMGTLLAILIAGVTYLGAAKFFKVQALSDLLTFIHVLRASTTIKPDAGNL